MSNGTVTVINTLPFKEQPIPEIGKEYYAFDDGKISPSRLEVVKIIEVIPFSECTDLELMGQWADEVIECYWLYATATDYFVKAEYEDEIAYFVRTTDGGWFSLGWFGSRLDVTGELYEKIKALDLDESSDNQRSDGYYTGGYNTFLKEFLSDSSKN